MRTRLSCLSLCALAFISTQAIADNKRSFSQNIEERDYAFQEQEVSLPEYPTENGDWIELYVHPTFKNKPKLLRSSVKVLSNASVSYVLNNQSANGIDNISFENLRCSTQSFRSEYNNGVRQIAFADTYNKRWLESRNAQWRDVGSNLNTNTPVQEMLSRVFCDGGLPRNDKEIDARLTKIGTYHPSQNRGAHEYD